MTVQRARRWLNDSALSRAKVQNGCMRARLGKKRGPHGAYLAIARNQKPKPESTAEYSVTNAVSFG